MSEYVLAYKNLFFLNPALKGQRQLTVFSCIGATDGGRRGAGGIGHAEGVGQALGDGVPNHAGTGLVGGLAVEHLHHRVAVSARAGDDKAVEVQAELQTTRMDEATL